jgi:hypothetical protein
MIQLSMIKNIDTIVFFLPRLHNNIRPLINGLLTLNYQITVLASRTQGIEDHESINTIYVKHRKKNREMISIKKIFDFFRTEKPKFLVVRNDEWDITFIIIFLMGIFFRSKIILYNQFPKFDPKLTKKLYNYTFYRLFSFKTITPVLNKFQNSPNLNYYETPAEYDKRISSYLNDTMNQKYVFWLPFASDKWLKEKTLQKDRIRVLTIGKIVPRKNIEKVVKYLSNFSNTYNIRISLTILSEFFGQNKDYLDNLNLLISKLKSPKFEVNLKLNQNRKSVAKHFQESEIFILLSENEPASVSQVEAFDYLCKILVYYQNGNLDFLPITPSIKIIYSLSEFDSRFAQLMQEDFSEMAFRTIYKKYFDKIFLAKRLINLFYE